MTETKEQIIERMTDLIASVARENNGECTRDHIRAAGFTEEQIDRCFPLSSGYAATKLNKNITTN